MGGIVPTCYNRSKRYVAELQRAPTSLPVVQKNVENLNYEARGGRAAAGILHELGAMPHVLAALRQFPKDAFVVQNGVQCLHEMTVNVPAARHMIESNVVEVTDALGERHARDPLIVSLCADMHAALERAIRDERVRLLRSPEGRRAEVLARELPALPDLEEEQEFGLDRLIELTHSDEGNAELAEHALHLVDAVVTPLRHFEGFSLQAKCCHMISVLAQADPRANQILGKRGAVELVEHAFRSHRNPNTRQQAVWALGALAADAVNKQRMEQEERDVKGIVRDQLDPTSLVPKVGNMPVNLRLLWSREELGL